jgi:hypothetical protein
MNLVFAAQDAAWKDWIEEVERQIEAAEAGAVQDVAKIAVKEGRANIAGAGFSTRWSAALKSKFYANKNTGNPEALIFHSISFAEVFERGATIRGKPLLWLPLERNLPAGIRSPRQYGGKLVSVNVAGKPPLLFDAAKREMGPLFVGVRQVNIRKRFDLYSIFAQAADRMGEFYDNRIKD